MLRKIIHVDQDCFYAAVEVRDNPRLSGKPVAVGGTAEGRGVLTTANYEARKYGVKSAMPTSRALKLCPHLNLVPINFTKYRTESSKIREVFKKFTDKIEPLSLDEAYLDVTNSAACNGSATLMAQEIRKQIFELTQLTASAGIAQNKFLAKVASDWNKPNGQFTIQPSQVLDFVSKLPVQKIPGVGKVTTKKMKSLGLLYCSDIQKLSIQELMSYFGTWGIRLHEICRGIDKREVKVHGVCKSLSVENTFKFDLKNYNSCKKQLPALFTQLIERLDNNKNKIHSLVVKVKFFDFSQTTLVRSKLKVPTLENYISMLEEAYHREAKPVRLIGLGVKFEAPKMVKKTAQLELF